LLKVTISASRFLMLIYAARNAATAFITPTVQPNAISMALGQGAFGLVRKAMSRNRDDRLQ
jgi:hypothetical protein